jgi:hypothetical protein
MLEIKFRFGVFNALRLCCEFIDDLPCPVRRSGGGATFSSFSWGNSVGRIAWRIKRSWEGC